MTEEKRDELFDAIGEYFDECGTGTIIRINNRWNDETSDGNYIYDIGDFDDHYSRNLPSDIADAVISGEYDSCDDYFVDDGYCHTFCDPTDWIDYAELTNYIIDNDEDFCDSRLRELLDEANKEEDDDTIILIHPKYGEDIAIGKEEFRTNYGTEAYLYFTENNEVMNGEEIVKWVEEHGGAELVLTEFTLKKFLEQNGFTETRNVCTWEGIIFGDDTCYDDGRFFQWFYCPENGLVLKIYMQSPATHSTLYFKEIVEFESELDMYRLIKRYIH